MRNGEGFLLVYSITSRMSFEEIETFHQQICRVKDKDRFPMVLIGNKTDLESERQVSSQEGKDLAEFYGCEFVETSAKLRLQVDDAFHAVVRNIRKYNKVQPAKQPVAPILPRSQQHQQQQDQNESKCCILM